MLDSEDLEDASIVEGNWRHEQPQGRFDMLRRVRQVTPATEASVSRGILQWARKGDIPKQNGGQQNTTVSSR